MNKKRLNLYISAESVAVLRKIAYETGLYADKPMSLSAIVEGLILATDIKLKGEK